MLIRLFNDSGPGCGGESIRATACRLGGTEAFRLQGAPERTPSYRIERIAMQLIHLTSRSSYPQDSPSAEVHFYHAGIAILAADGWTLEDLAFVGRISFGFME